MRDAGDGVALVRGVCIQSLEYKAVLVGGLVPNTLAVNVENLLMGGCRRDDIESVILDFANGAIVQQQERGIFSEGLLNWAL